MISVILPVYNDEKYLHTCLDSILKQTYDNFEIICIDNNSNDSTLDILKYYDNKDSRIKIFKNEINKGLGHCMNKGLKLANGKYIIFLNARTGMNFNAFEYFINNLEKNNLEVLLFKILFFNENNHEFYTENNFDMNYLNGIPSKVFNHLNLNKNEIFSIPKEPWNKVYLKSFLDLNKIQFSNEKLSHEFDSFFYEMILTANRISFLDKYLINYSIDPNINNSTNKLLIENMSFVYKILDIFLENKNYYSHYKKELFKFIFSSIYDEFNSLEEKSYEKFFKETSWFYKDLVKYYGLYEEILDNVDKDILIQLKFNELLNEVNHSNPRISVIIPVYNVRNYLSECLKSVINQTFKDIEIICVNDGSTDESLDILRMYAKKDKRIVIFNQENQGQGTARNRGLENAMGDYVFFLDSDDYLSLDALELLYNNAKSNKSDLVIYKISRLNEEEIIYTQDCFPLDEIFGEVNFSDFTFNYQDIKKHVLNSSFAPFPKLYKKDFINQHDDLRFSVGIKYEDVIFHVKSLLKASKISFLPEFCYVYRVSNTNSTMKNNKHVWDIFKVSEEVENFLTTSDYINEFEIEFKIFKIIQFSQYITLANSKEYTQHVIEQFNEIDLEGVPNYFVNIYNSVMNKS